MPKEASFADAAAASPRSGSQAPRSDPRLPAASVKEAPRSFRPELDLETAGPATLVRIGLARERFPSLSAAAAWDLMMELEAEPTKTVWRDGGAYTLDNANLPVFIPGLEPDPVPPKPVIG